jgi:hypothetical protein
VIEEPDKNNDCLYDTVTLYDGKCFSSLYCLLQRTVLKKMIMCNYDNKSDILNNHSHVNDAAL